MGFFFFFFLTVVRLLGQPAEAELTAASDAETCVFSPTTVEPEQTLECGAVQADPGPVSSTEPPPFRLLQNGAPKPVQVPKNLTVFCFFFLFW